jgi:hypothetical protein
MSVTTSNQNKSIRGVTSLCLRANANAPADDSFERPSEGESIPGYIKVPGNCF